MGQVCFTAISSNRACPTVFIALSSVFQIIVLCACYPSVQWLGLRAKVPSSLRHCTRSAVACWAVGVQTCSQAHARTPGRFSIGSGAYMQVRGHQWAGTCFCWPHSAMPSPYLLLLVIGPKGLVGTR